MGGGGGGVIQQAQPQNTFGRASLAPPYQPAPAYSNRGPIAKNEAPARIVPIAALNPYQGRWTIKARVTAKSEVRRFHNAKGDGKVFSFDLLDADKGEIRATCFNNVVDQFYDSIDVGRVYLVSKGSLKAAQKSFNHLKNDWEIFLESQVLLCARMALRLIRELCRSRIGLATVWKSQCGGVFVIRKGSSYRISVTLARTLSWL
jgi:replication factor A1